MLILMQRIGLSYGDQMYDNIMATYSSILLLGNIIYNLFVYFKKQGTFWQRG